MTTTLSIRQGLLTRALNRLERTLEQHSDLLTLVIEPPGDEQEQHAYISTHWQRLRQAKVMLDAEIDKVDKSLEQYSKAADELKDDVPSIEEILQKVTSNVDAATARLDRAYSASTTMFKLLEELRELREERPIHAGERTPIAPLMNLAPIPIPKFSGRIWEWETFWGVFEHAVHSRQMDDLYKLNYLLDALQGDAKESVKQFEISRRTYPLIVAHLKNKYGNTQTLIDQMVRRLQRIQGLSDRLEDQEKLCEQIASLTTQLNLKGENIDNIFLQKQLLAKFTESIQRHVHRQKELQSPESTWSTEAMLGCVKDYITTELRVMRRVDKKEEKTAQGERKEPRKTRPQFSSASKGYVCFYCDKRDHTPKDCNIVKNREERLEVMRKKMLCRNCGLKDHMAKYCPAGACRLCGIQGHNTSICPQLSGPPRRQPNTAPDKPVSQSKTPTKKGSLPRTSVATKVHPVLTERLPSQEDAQGAAVYINHQGSSASVHILVGQAYVRNTRDQALETIHVMLDTGADRSFISNELADRLQLQNVSTVELTINTFGSSEPLKRTCGVTELQMWDAEGTAHTIVVTRIDTLTEPLRRSALSREDQIFLRDRNIRLSIDPEVEEIRPLVLLGCADLYSLLDHGFEEQTTLPSGLRLLPSKLGYLVSGRDTKDSPPEDSLKDEPHVTVEFDSTPEDPEIPQQSWEDYCTFEASGVHEFTGPCSEERKGVDAQVWQMFEATIEKKEDGYHVRLPWREDAAKLPDNKAIAVRRLEATIARLNNDLTTFQQYDEAIQRQLQKGVIEEVNEATRCDGAIVHYLAHQAILTPHKETTKLRVVFDASAHLKGQPSLNDVLYPGPVLLPRICDILLRFRIGASALVSDVEKAFLQVRLHQTDRDATRFLWIRDIAQPVKATNIVTYRFTRVTFGLNCSPFLLAGTIRHHLNNSVKNKELAQNISENTYVDNVILTARCPDDALQLYINSKGLFQELNMNLREYRSNEDTVNAQIATADLSTNVLQKVLGVQWNTCNDQLLLSCRYRPKEKLTKRVISEQVASIYDPLGLLTPLTLRGKQFLQQLWKSEYDWDEELSEEHQVQWEEIVADVHGFEITIPRKIAQIQESSSLVGFADASANGMATCVYLVTGDRSNIICGKSKLPASKINTTVPKLELNALTMAVRLTHTIFRAISQQANIRRIVILSDSKIALGWIRATNLDTAAGVLVRNRVAEIRAILKEFKLPVQFGYVSTSDNPADCGTRGVSKVQLEAHIWWHGPCFIKETVEKWPKETDLFTLPESTTEEGNNVTLATTSVGTTTSSDLLDWTRSNKLTSLTQRITYVLRFIRQLSKKVNDKLREKLEGAIPELQQMTTEPYVTAIERDMALRVIVRHHQQICFSPEKQKALKQLNIYLDDSRILRCRGRIGKADMDFDTKHPMLVASKTGLARAIVNDAHLPYHCSTGQTIANVRQRFWIPKLRQMVKTELRSCVPCQKVNNLPFKYPDMGDLPERRIRRTRPFEHVGIDYFGPLMAKIGDTARKVYGIILTCTTTRLLHLELVPDMSTTQLLLALRKFFARRGVPASITSDNGPMFLLGEQILRDAVLPVVNDVTLATSMATKGITWKTITPYAPWQGAFYERLIKSVKQSLYKVMKRSIVSREELETFLIEIEGTLNCRPLTYQEDKWEDSPVLRPIDFVQRDIIVTFPFECLQENESDSNFLPQDEAIALRTRREAEEALKSSHRLTEKFWVIWKEHYLTSLREVHKLEIDKKGHAAKGPRIGDVVLISDPVLPRNSWKMARIVDLPQDNNGNIREAQMKLPSGRLCKRPVNLLVPLELEENIEPGKEANERSQAADAKRYNLRPRRKVSYKEDSGHAAAVTSSISRSIATSTLFVCLTMLLIIPGALSLSPTATISGGQLTCIEGGVSIITRQIRSFELCVEGICQVSNNPRDNETILFPPEVLLHKHHVQLKLSDGQNITVLETSCPEVAFCEHVRCWLCTANIFNPQCSPRTAIAGIAIIVYIAIALLYALCYVPLVIGKPFRIGGRIAWSICRGFCWCLRRIRRWQGHRRRRFDVETLLRAPLIAAAMVIIVAPATLACQDINVFSSENSICTISSKGKKECSLETTEIVKINSFSREGCIRLFDNSTVQKEIRIQWKGVRLTCQKTNAFFTRSTSQRTIDSKRCSHSGSCVASKCESIKTTSLIPELSQGNQYPGITRCVESCGGPGCGCFYLSSGCLFYRIFHVPVDEKVYELFKCSIWKEEVLLDVTVISHKHKTITNRTTAVKPTVPIKIEGMSITLTTLTLPPTPILSSTFISDGKDFAIWNQKQAPHLQCDSEESARTLNCTATTSCNCDPAENKVKCLCQDVNITESFTKEIGSRFPIRRPWITFTADTTKKVTAHIPSLVAAEVFVQLREKFERTVKVVTDERCMVPNSVAKGCYRCLQGAEAEIYCTTDGNSTMATVQCDEEYFTIPCTPSGATTIWRFSHPSAKVKKECQVSCGSTTTRFEITGILQWVRTLSGAAARIAQGESNVYNEMILPDFSHIFDVILHWYKTLLSTVVLVALALIVGYILLWTCGLRVLIQLIRTPFRLMSRIIKIVVWIFKIACKSLPSKTTKGMEKQL